MRKAVACGILLFTSLLAGTARDDEYEGASATAKLRNDMDVTSCYARILGVNLMAVVANPKSKRETLNLRIKPEVRGLIDRAARLAGKNRTDFVLDAARQAAEAEVLDRVIMTVGSNAYVEVVARLDAPPQPNERLRRSLQTAAPWA